MRILTGALLWLLSGAASATTLSTDYTDLWFKSNEPGWGVNLAQQNDTIVATLFIYDGLSAPDWLIAPNTTLRDDGTFTGPLYHTTGPNYANRPFDPTAVTVNLVGSLTFDPSSPSRATLVYRIGGRVITKAIVRQSWRSDNLSGFYFGSRQGTWSGCTAALNGKVDAIARVGVTHNGNNVIISDNGNGYSCTYQGMVLPQGRYSEIIGTAVCDDHLTREFDATEVYVSREAITMRYSIHETGTACNFDGYGGGIREVP